MVFATHIVGFQAVLVLFVRDLAVHVLVEDVLEAGDLCLGKPELKVDESVLERLLRDASGVGIVTNTEETFGREILSLQLRHKFVHHRLFGVFQLGLAQVGDLNLALLGQVLHLDAG